jgi:hypothetical protein
VTMRLIKILGAVSMVLAMEAGSVSAMPQTPPVEGNALVQQVQVDCHPDVRNHYLPQYGRRVLHRHRQGNCRVVLVEPQVQPRPPRDCHRDVRRHFLPEYGRSVYHKHVGPSCRIRIYNPYQGGGSAGPSCIKIGVVTLCEGR